MSRPSVDLSAPPSELSSFPARDPVPHELFRIAFHRTRSGELNSPWRFSSVPPGASRFDLPVPHGTGYWSDRRYGAFVEVFRAAPIVDRADVTRRRLFATAPPHGLRLADTTSREGYAFGLTGELSTTVPYELPQAWARALHRARFDGMVGFCRHDPSLEARNVAIFGPSGTRSRRTGWRTRRSALDVDEVLAVELAALGVRIAPVPHVVPTISAPDPAR